MSEIASKFARRKRAIQGLSRVSIGLAGATARALCRFSSARLDFRQDRRPDAWPGTPTDDDFREPQMTTNVFSGTIPALDDALHAERQAGF